jgi:signal peptidase II
MSEAQPISRRRRLAVVGGIALGGVVLDQVSKVIAIRTLKGGPTHVFFGDIFRLTYAENEGAFLSLFANLPDLARFLLLTGFNSLILVVVLAVLLFRERLAPHALWALALILSGGVGNLIDRIFRDGRVVDFMNLGWPGPPFAIRTGIFNVADLAIVAGLVVMVLFEFRGADKASGPKA